MKRKLSPPPYEVCILLFLYLSLCRFLCVYVFLLLSLQLGRCSSDLFLSSRPRTGLATTCITKNLIGQGGDILFVSDSPIFKNVFYNSNSLNYSKWKRGGLSKFKEVDLVILNDIGKENLVEAHRKCLLLVGVGRGVTDLGEKITPS